MKTSQHSSSKKINSGKSSKEKTDCQEKIFELKILNSKNWFLTSFCISFHYLKDVGYPWLVKDLS